MVWAVAASLLNMCGSRFVFIIDAMDECLFDGPSLPGISAFLDALLKSTRETRSKVVIFTRPEPMFVTAMQSDLSIFMAKDLLLPDIMTFARREYEQLGLPDSEMDQVLELVRSSSHGSFRWAELFLHHLGQSLQTADLRTRMRTLPPSIGELYRQSLLSGVQRFSQDELEYRKALLLTIFQAQRPLRTTEIADAFSLRPERAEIIISSLCKPLASTFGGFFHLSHPSVREFFELYHQAGDSSLGISFSDSHGLLAEKCLSSLLEERYADLHRIESYLTANYDENSQAHTDAQPCEGSFYDYAFRFWDYHLVRTKVPSKNLLRQANNFILSLQFTYWSERSRQECGQLVRVNLAFGFLVPWHKGLSREGQELLELDKYFERSYSLLGAAFDSSKMDNVLPWLAHMAMGDFYFMRHLPDKATWTRQQVLARLQGLLGPRHHLTLCAKSGVAYVRLYAGKMRASYRMYNEVVDIQREVLGERSSHFLETLLYKGESEYYMADFVAAITTWTKLSAECLGLLGPDSWLYLATQWWYAQGVTYMGQLDLGLRIFQSVVQKRHELFGPGDSFANVVQGSVGEIQLLLGRHEESIATIRHVLVSRREVYPPSHIYRLDTEITLATAYQAAGMKQTALAIVEEIEEGAGNLYSWFERYCQVAHLKGLLLAQGGSIDEAIHLLQNTVTQAEEDQNNRALLWIRLDLATLLKRRDAEGDRDQASVNFDNIVKDISGDSDPGFPDEPDPPRLLVATEKALRLVRARKHAEARRELDSEKLDWRRPSDFWLWVGGAFCKDLLQITDSALTRAG
jgi:tetratricopeptide (TPR) repeat protein